MPSVWTLVGAEARTAFTVYVFQVSTASGGTTTGLCVFAEAACSDAVAATARMPTRTGTILIRTVHCFMYSSFFRPQSTASVRRRLP